MMKLCAMHFERNEMSEDLEPKQLSDVALEYARDLYDFQLRTWLVAEHEAGKQYVEVLRQRPPGQPVEDYLEAMRKLQEPWIEKMKFASKMVAAQREQLAPYETEQKRREALSAISTLASESGAFAPGTGGTMKVQVLGSPD